MGQNYAVLIAKIMLFTMIAFVVGVVSLYILDSVGFGEDVLFISKYIFFFCGTLFLLLYRERP